MVNDLFIFIAAFFMVVQGAAMATKYAARLALSFHLSKFTVGFIMIAIISILPETFIAINAAIEGIPSFGLGTLFGSNVADLTLVFAVMIFFAGRCLKVEGKILKNHVVYPFILFLPLVLGLNGHFSRLEGLALIIAGTSFYYIVYKRGNNVKTSPYNGDNKYKNLLMLVSGMAILLVGSHFIVTSAVEIANCLKINPILIGMLVVGLGTTIPELFFALKSVKKKDECLAIGDVLGTVLADATIVVGILALMRPFYFPSKIIYVTGLFMVVASLILFRFMKTERTLTKREAYLLFAYWLIFALAEFMTNR